MMLTRVQYVQYSTGVQMYSGHMMDMRELSAHNDVDTEAGQSQRPPRPGEPRNSDNSESETRRGQRGLGTYYIELCCGCLVFCLWLMV